MRLDVLLSELQIPYPPAGAYVGEGWVPLLHDCLIDLIALGWNKQVTQIKEKFGGLRIYIGPERSEIYPQIMARISQAEDLSLKTCDVCGDPGTQGQESWIRTRCPADRLVR